MKSLRFPKKLIATNIVLGSIRYRYADTLLFEENTYKLI